MPDENKEIDDILDPELSKEEQRRQRTEQLEDDLGDYQLEDFSPDENYEITDAQKDIEKLKQEVRSNTNQEKKSPDQMDSIEKMVSEMEKQLRYKNQGREEKIGHLHHSAYAAMAGMTIMMLAFRWSPIWTYIYFMGLAGYFRGSVEFLPEPGKNKYARLVQNHPKFFIYGGGITSAIMMSTGAEFPMPPGVRTEITRTMLSWIVGA